MKNSSEPSVADLLAQAPESLRLAFGLACVERIEHLLEDPVAIACVAVLRGFIEGRADGAALSAAAQQMAQIAQSHRGSGSIDGCSHAAVSAAEYTAYAMVYAYGGYAVGDPSAFEPEHAWQRATLQELSFTQAPAS